MGIIIEAGTPQGESRKFTCLRCNCVWLAYPREIQRVLCGDGVERIKVICPMDFCSEPRVELAALDSSPVQHHPV